ncbi:MAG TPA: hypothetical protein VHY22_13705 [Chthoniobacteraceae bacterium]|nr:hypothetical protein [Chthoniobacteraceae bacterium]
MKRFVLFLALASITAPLFAHDSEGDGVTIPPIAELMREGYGPVIERREDFNLLLGGPTIMAKPTQAYRDDTRHRTIYYGFRPVALNRINASEQYAFGYPLDFFKNLIPNTPSPVSLDTLAVAVYDSPARAEHRTATTTSHSTVTTVKPAP